MRELFRAMIDADKELPRTMVIAQLKWRQLDTSTERTEIRQNGEWYETDLARGEEGLTVLLKVLTAESIPVKLKPAKAEYHIPVDVTLWRAFSRTEILDFVTDVRDMNSIHQQENAVAPVSAIKIRFRRPTFVNELISLETNGRTIQGFTEHRPVFTCTFK